MEVLREWSELEPDGEFCVMRWAQFASIPEQLGYLRNMIDVYRGTHWARSTALEIVRAAGCETRNQACMALAIAEAVKARVQYVREFPERFQTPPRTWKDRAGDCDDFTTTEGALMESIGIATRVVGMKVNDKWRHVYVEAMIEVPGGRKLPMPLDATLRNTPLRELANPITRALARGMKVETLRL